MAHDSECVKESCVPRLFISKMIACHSSSITPTSLSKPELEAGMQIASSFQLLGQLDATTSLELGIPHHIVRS